MAIDKLNKTFESGQKLLASEMNQISDKIDELVDGVTTNESNIPDVSEFATKTELQEATPTIGENGNWVVGGQDTGKPSKGADGVSLGEISLVQTTGTSTESVMSQKAVTDELVKRTTELNISALYPTQGIDGSNKYTLETAIAQVPTEYRFQGIKVSFVNESSDTETWEYKGTTWTAGNFSKIGAKRFSELHNENIGNISTNNKISPFVLINKYSMIDDGWYNSTTGEFVDNNSAFQRIDYPIVPGVKCAYCKNSKITSGFAICFMKGETLLKSVSSANTIEKIDMSLYPECTNIRISTQKEYADNCFVLLDYLIGNVYTDKQVDAIISSLDSRLLKTESSLIENFLLSDSKTWDGLFNFSLEIEGNVKVGDEYSIRANADTSKFKKGGDSYSLAVTDIDEGYYYAKTNIPFNEEIKLVADKEIKKFQIQINKDNSFKEQVDIEFNVSIPNADSVYERINSSIETINEIDNKIINLEKELIYEEYSNIDNNGRLNAYAYSTSGTFFTNQYTSGYYYSLYILPPNSKVKVKLKKTLERITAFAGLINSQDDFIVGGKITDFILTGDDELGTEKYISVEDNTTKYLVVLGTKTNVSEYCEVMSVSVSTVKEKLQNLNIELEDIQESLGKQNEICCPDVFYAVVGQELNIYYDSIIKGLDAGLQSPFGIYVDIQCPDLQNASNQIGVRRERMWQIDGAKLTSAYIGEHNLQITAYDNNGKQLSQKNAKIFVTNSTPLSSQKYILCIGDSLTNNGPIVATMGQHFQDLGGTQPIFVGQRTSSGYKHEGYPGYNFTSFVSNASNYAYRIFDVPTGTNVSVNDKYSTNSSQYVIRDIRTEGLDNKLRLRCERSSGTTEPNPTGTLTKISGSSSSEESIEYSAYEKESGNPFWDLETGRVSFTKYREKIGMNSNKFDLVIIMLGTNDCIGYIKDMNPSLVSAKKLIEAIFEDSSDYSTKVILQMSPADANTISSWQVYGDLEGGGRKIAYWTNLWNLRKLLYDEFTKTEWNSKVYLGQAALGLDRYYGFPYTEVNSSNRISTIKEIYHTNCVHPNNNGYQQIGDGYYLQALSLLK